MRAAIEGRRHAPHHAFASRAQCGHLLALLLRERNDACIGPLSGGVLSAPKLRNREKAEIRNPVASESLDHIEEPELVTQRQREGAGTLRNLRGDSREAQHALDIGERTR